METFSLEMLALDQKPFWDFFQMKYFPLTL